eukprot:3683716-Heterocapsa_arctica.AAC.1
MRFSRPRTMPSICRCLHDSSLPEEPATSLPRTWSRWPRKCRGRPTRVISAVRSCAPSHTLWWACGGGASTCR